MEAMSVMIRFIYISVISFALAYPALSLSGVMSVTRPGPEAVFYSLPLFASSFVLLLTLMVDMFIRRSRIGWAGLTLLVSVALLSVGYWMDALMSYSLRAVITEGQSVSVREMHTSAPAGGYVGKYAEPPEAVITLLRLRPELAEGGNSLRAMEGDFLVAGPHGRDREVRVELGEQYTGEGYGLGIEGFGYSPRYELRNAEGKWLDSSFVYLRLFPPGSEDSFRLLSPLTYYLRYFPDGDSGAYFKVRVARNKSLVFNGDVPLGGSFRYENASMILPEVRHWTTLVVMASPGRPLMTTGALGTLVALLYLAFRNRRVLEMG